MAIAVNPVLARELKERMRGRRAVIILTIYLTLLTAGLWLVYEAASSANDFGNPLPTQLAEVGSTVFEWVLFFMLLILLFLVPAQTAGAIAGERERQTLIPLQITLLSPRSILVGKVCAAMSFLGLLVVAAVPLMSIAYLIGGVTIPQVLGGTALVLATGVCVATMCAAISTFTRRVQGATVLAYGLTIALALGTLLAYGAAAVIDQSRGIDEADPPAWLIALNPVAIVGDLVGSTDSGNQTSPFDAIKNLTDPDEDDQAQFQDVGGFEVGPAPIGADAVLLPGGLEQIGGDFGGGLEPVPAGDRGIPFWAGSLLALAALATVTLLRAARRLRTPAERER
jgi:ABC-type transport system involved in multi-copper enzyme maturation permease subunit